MQPISELNGIRGEQTDFNNIELLDEGRALDVQALALDNVAECEVSLPVGLALACSPDGSEQASAIYDPGAIRLIVNRSRSSSDPRSETFPHTGPHKLSPGELLELRILLDGSILEIIANGRASVCSGIYPSHSDCRDKRLFGGRCVQSSRNKIRPK
jgi:beta-fructofuranosidase